MVRSGLQPQEGKEKEVSRLIFERLLAAYSGGKGGIGFYFSIYAIARHLLEREAHVGRRREDRDDSGHFTQIHATHSIAFDNDRKVQSKFLEQTLVNVQPYQAHHA